MSLYDIVPSSERALAQLSYKLSNTMERLARYQNHLTFIRHSSPLFIPVYRIVLLLLTKVYETETSKSDKVCYAKLNNSTRWLYVWWWLLRMRSILQPS